MIKAFFTNLIFSGKYDHIGGEKVTDTRESTTYALFNGLMLTGILGVLIFFILNIITRTVSDFMLYLDAILFVVLIFMTLLARTKVSLWVPAGLASGFYTIFAMYMLFTAASGMSSPAWLLLVPTVIIYLMKRTLSIIVFWLSVGFSFYALFINQTYDVALGARYFGVFIILYAFGVVVNKWLTSLTEKAVESAILLEEEKEELNAMRNNIDLGIFLLDRDFTLQPLYSKHLIEIFETENLTGADFVSLFRNSLLPEEIDALYDFLDMMFTTPDTTLLQTINPLQKTQWKSVNGIKHLSISVSRIEKHGEPLILGTIKDSTKEVELERQVAEEEAKRQNEIKVIAEVMHATPEALAEFISDTEHEFGEINNTLKANTSSHIVTFQQVYQSVHAIKSNALILGLQTLADKLHAVEGEINSRIEKGGRYEDVLSLMFVLENVMTEIDVMKNIVKRLTQFSATGVATDSRGIFVKGILNTIDKVTASTEDGIYKIVELDVKKLEWEDISTEKRRDIKDIVFQLVRNSCAHGIEKAEDRKSKGKNEQATIHLSIEKEGDHLHIDCGDDGNGIDYEKVLKKGKELNLLPGDTTVENKAVLMKLLTSPSFSTAEEVSQYAGRGVGLSLVVDKVKKYGGKIKIKSSKGVGTSFIMTI